MMQEPSVKLPEDRKLNPVSNSSFTYPIELLKKVNGMYDLDQQLLDEFEQHLALMVDAAKKTGAPQLLNWCGHFDLLVTEHRIHVILVTESYYLPVLQKVGDEQVSSDNVKVELELPFALLENLVSTAEALDKKRSEVVQAALMFYFSKLETFC